MIIIVEDWLDEWMDRWSRSTGFMTWWAGNPHVDVGTYHDGSLRLNVYGEPRFGYEFEDRHVMQSLWSRYSQPFVLVDGRPQSEDQFVFHRYSFAY